MKKKMGILGGLLMAVVVTGYSVAGTYAKYTSSLDFADEARVAKWNFTLNGETTTKNLDINLFAKSYAVETNLPAEDGEETDVVSNREGVKVVAPGTRGTYTFELEGTAETNYTVEFAAELTNEIKKDSYDPLYFRLNDSDWMTSEDFEAYLNKTIQDANNTVYAANSTLGQEYTIEWMWAFDGKDTTTLPGFVSNNVLDTELAQLVGADNNGALVRLDVQLTINQSDKAAGTAVTVERKNAVATFDKTLSQSDSDVYAGWGYDATKTAGVTVTTVGKTIKLGGTIQANNDSNLLAQYPTAAEKSGYYYPIVINSAEKAVYITNNATGAATATNKKITLTNGTESVLLALVNDATKDQTVTVKVGSETYTVDYTGLTFE